ncbi:MAG: hypothetical protein OXH93_12800 [Caldilineaceae bacterium]|nr:hypothetical protein [Caldilineaceae bacterium]
MFPSDDNSRPLTSEQREYIELQEKKAREWHARKNVSPDSPTSAPVKPSRDHVYGGNYPKSRKLAMARSKGKCQFCGLQQAVEAHHWAYPHYPSAHNVQSHDLTALCKACHEFATVIRDWVAKKDARFDDLVRELDYCNTFVAKREAISYWLYPDGDQKFGSSTYQSSYSRPRKKTSSGHSYKPRNASQKTDKLLAFLFWFILVPVLLALLVYAFGS